MLNKVATIGWLCGGRSNGAQGRQATKTNGDRKPLRILVRMGIGTHRHMSRWP